MAFRSLRVRMKGVAKVQPLGSPLSKRPVPLSDEFGGRDRPKKTKVKWTPPAHPPPRSVWSGRFERRVAPEPWRGWCHGTNWIGTLSVSQAMEGH